MDTAMLHSCEENYFPDCSIYSECIEAVFIYDKDGRIIACNRSAREELGYDGQNESIMSAFPKVFYKRNDELCLLDGIREDMLFDTVAYRKNMTCYPAMVKILKDKKTDYYICFAQNMSNENAAMKKMVSLEGKLKNAIQVKNEFIANITHELRTPVNGMKGFAQSLQKTKLDPAQQENVEYILHCCTNMEGLINQLLDFSKMEAGKVTLEKREFDFYHFIEETLALNLPQINEKGLRVRISIGKKIPQIVIGDEFRLGQIINNLFSNAVKFTQAGTISFEVVNTAQNGKEIELFFVVCDTGIGIAREDMDKLFNSFTQVDSSITRRFGGTGLGLAICKQLVEQMDGDIYVNSELGKGSTFSFSVRLDLPGNEKEEGEKEAEGFSTQWSQRLKEYMSVSESESSEEDTLKLMREKLERVLLCIELGTWEKADKFAGMMKAAMPDTMQELKREVFRLELMIRREDYDLSLQQVKKIQDKIES
ncbi:MAG: hypothetical protein E7256_01600 [Lachnospiraceae bacterium]|nr:hypothetical protein [Lachnospiraceae bacterium]